MSTAPDKTNRAALSASSPERADHPRRSRRPSWLSPTLAELAIVAILFGAASALVYGEHAIEGGFLSDDWALRATVDAAEDPGLFGAVDALNDKESLQGRPLMAVYMATTHTLFGGHMGWHLAWAGALGGFLAFAVFVFLRTVLVRRAHAFVIAALVFLFPASDATRLWAGSAAGLLTVALYVLGAALALRAFAADGTRARLVHAASLLLYLASLFLHESTLVAILASVVLYRLRVPWSRALRRWALDVAVAVFVIALVTTQSSSFPRQSLAGQLEHARIIVDRAVELLGAVVVPVGLSGWMTLLILGLLFAIATVVAARTPSSDRSRAELQRWSTLGIAGACVVAAGYAVYVPAIDYYVPTANGIANRMNVLPSIGFVLLTYAAIVVLVLLVARIVPVVARYVVPLTVVVAAILGASYYTRLSDDQRLYQRAYAIGAETLAMMKRSMPPPPSGSTIYSFGQPIEVVPGVPVFGNTWDLTGAVQLLWDDHSLVGLPAFPGVTFACGRETMRPTLPRYGGTFESRYGRTVLFDAPSGRSELIANREQCQTLTTRFAPGPEYAPVGYGLAAAGP